MGNYIIELNKLLPGDIVLVRDDRPTSKAVREATHSQYSHALLYTGYANYIDAGKIVKSGNLQRKIFKEADDACVLRLQPSSFYPFAVMRAIMYARLQVGTLYSMRDAYKMKEGCADKPEDNRQICTRLIAYAYKEMKLVENPDFSTPEDIFNSKKLIHIEDFMREASEDEIDFSKSYNVIDDQSEILYNMLKDAQKVTNSDIQSLAQMVSFDLNNQGYDDCLCDIVVKSGYLDIWKKEEEINSYNYNVSEFKDKYSKSLNESAKTIIHSSILEKERYQFERDGLTYLLSKNSIKLRLLVILRDLYDQLIEHTDRRIRVAEMATNRQR